MKISLACDHGGYELKEKIKAHLLEKGYEVTDHGTNSTESVSYPQYAHYVCEDIQKNLADRGVLVCGTGIGMSIAANKHKGIRAAVVSDTFSARLTRMHNNTNILCLGGRVVGFGLGLDIVDAYLDAEFEGGRHQGRLDEIEKYAAMQNDVE